MSSLSILCTLPEEQFECSICLNVFSDPVTTPCGHSFCKACISKRWDNSEMCHCPTCNKRFCARPEVSTNTIIEEISVQIKRRKLDVPVPERFAEAWEVPCDVCTGSKLKALKSCAVCLTSYCETHLEPHQRVPALRRHKLIEPVENLEDRMCKKHERLLEMFCRDEQMCVCMLCVETDHRCHDTVPIEEEGPHQKEKIECKTKDIQMMIEERIEKIEEITQCCNISKETTNKEIEDSNKLFTALMTRVQLTQTKLKSSIVEKQKGSEDKTNTVIQELQQEITELRSRKAELEELSLTEDHLHLLQTFQTLCTHSPTKDWSQIRVFSDLFVETTRRAVSHLVKAFGNELKTLTNMELKRMKEFKESVTLDSNTASRWLSLSEGGKRVKYSKTANSASVTPERFDLPMVLGEKGFNSGRHYWEVQVGLRTDWDVGVAKETVTRKGTVDIKRENGFFALEKNGYDYQVDDTPYKTLYLNPRPRNVGVYVDYEEGRVSFYDVDEKSHIYSFTGECFTERLFPYFYVHSNFKKSEALVINYMINLRASLYSLISQPLSEAKK